MLGKFCCVVWYYFCKIILMFCHPYNSSALFYVIYELILLLMFLAADILLWKRWSVSLGVIVVASVAWFIFEWSGLPFLSICSDVLLILIIVLFVHSNYASYRDRYYQHFLFMCCFPFEYWSSFDNDVGLLFKQTTTIITRAWIVRGNG